MSDLVDIIKSKQLNADTLSEEGDYYVMNGGITPSGYYAVSAKEEILKMKNLVLPEGKEYLDPVRDVFLFCCFTGLRHSDVSGLRRNDVKGDPVKG